MWEIPEKKVFIDSRIEAYPPALLRRSQAADLFGTYEGLFRDYRIRCALVKTESPMAEALRRDGKQIFYSDAARTVFLVQQQ